MSKLQLAPTEVPTPKVFVIADCLVELCQPTGFVYVDTNGTSYTEFVDSYGELHYKTNI